MLYGFQKIAKHTLVETLQAATDWVLTKSCESCTLRTPKNSKSHYDFSFVFRILLFAMRFKCIEISSTLDFYRFSNIESVVSHNDEQF